MKPTQLLFLTCLLIICLVLAPIVLYAKKGKSLRIGTVAPHFSLPDQEGIQQELKNFLGKKIALCFYPKDNSPFCTKQLCSIRDGFAVLQEHGITIIGISADSEKKHQDFKKNEKLPFMLLSDTNKKVARLYDAADGWFGMLKRITILINEKGFIVDIIDTVDISDHAQQIVDGFAKNRQ